MAGDQPCDHENTECDIAAQLIFEVFEDFGGLVAHVRLAINTFKTRAKRSVTYRQQEVHDIHQTQHHIRDIIEAVDISGTQEGAGDKVVGQHLVVILAFLLHVDNKDLLHPE